MKRRADNDLDFVRLGEELFAAASLDIPLALSPSAGLDSESQWSLFKAMLIVDYQYSDMMRALDAVRSFGSEHPVIAVTSDDPLFDAIRELANSQPNIHIVSRASEKDVVEALMRLRLEKQPGAKELNTSRLAVSETVRRVLAVVESTKQAVTDAPAIGRTELARGVVRVDFVDGPARPVPVWIRQGYFPNWKSSEGYPVYIATPTFQLTFASRPTLEMRFEPDSAETAGWLITVLGVVVGAGVTLFRRRARKGTKLRVLPAEANRAELDSKGCLLAHPER